MPIIVSNQNYNDMFNVNLGFYRANAGDKQTYTCRLTENISIIETPAIVLSYFAGLNQISLSGASFLSEGFEAGDDIEVIIYNANGNVHHTNTVEIVSVTANTMIVNASMTWKSGTQYVYIIAKQKGGSKRNGLELNLNFLQQTGSLTPNSLIDGSVNKILFNLTGTTTNQVVTGTQVGIKSGQYAVSATITDKTTYPNKTRSYDLSVVFIQGGPMLQSSFDFGGCLKTYFGTIWQRTYGNPNHNTTFVISDNADTGWYDEPFNLGVANATLVSGISVLEFNTVQTGQISIDSASASFGFGAGYMPVDATYYKNQTNDQSHLSMLAETKTSAAPIILTSPTNPSGAGYTLEFSNPVTVGTVTTWDWEFTPNAAFITFMDARSIGDRLFYIWAKYGTVNLLLFEDQLTEQPPAPGVLDMPVHRFVDHSQNYANANVTKLGFEGNIEDDIAFIGKFLVPINANIRYAKAEIWSVNAVTDEEFLLNSSYFDFAGVPKVGGYYPVNQSQSVITTLPSTSVKLTAQLERDAYVDTMTHYGMRIYLPFFYSWQYWIAQPNANAFFFPNKQTRNWVPYGTETDWKLQLRVTVDINELDHIYSENIVIKDYDSDAAIDQTMDLEVVSTSQIVSVVVEGELHKISAYHTINTADIWDTATVWGMITIEPTEASPRWICSTTVAYDNNLANPLTPITGLYAGLIFPSPQVALIECYFNPNNVNLSNGVKFTSKIKGCYV
jgi:hypothetical protein